MNADLQTPNITTIRSGHPFTVQLGFNRSGNLNTTGFSMHERPDAVPGCDPVLGGPDRYWDIACFSMPAVNTRGNAPRNSVIGPGLAAVDLSLVKSLTPGSERHLEIKVEAVNRANLAVPSGRTAFTGGQRRRLAGHRADLGPHHVNGDDVAPDSAGREDCLLSRARGPAREKGG